MTHGFYSATTKVPAVAPTGTFRFEPTSDKFRIVSNTDISLRFHETSGLPVIRQEMGTLLSMGRQTRFHMLPEDCRRFVRFLQERDPVVVTRWHSAESAELEEVHHPWEEGAKAFVLD